MEEVLKLIRAENWKDINEHVKKLSVDEFDELLDYLSEEEKSKLIRNLRYDVVLYFLPKLTDEKQVEILSYLSLEEVSRLLEEIPIDEAVDIFTKLPLEERIKLEKKISKERLKEIRSLAKYKDDTAGGLMTTEFLAFSEDTTVEDAIAYIRKKAMEYETIYYVYVVDEEGKLKGVLSMRELVLAPQGAKLGEVMRRDVIKVFPEVDQEEVARIMKMNDLLAIPVVDHENRLLGIVTFDDIMEVIEKEALEDISSLAGTSESVDKLLYANIKDVVKARLPWLVFTIIGSGIIASSLLKVFESFLASTIALALFLPVVMAVGGSTGVQSAVIFIRGLATKDIKDTKKYMLREVKIGAIMGLIIGIFIAVFCHFLVGKFIIGFTVGLAVFFATCSAAFFGVLIPKIFEKVGIDPAVASNPLITSILDILGITIYLATAWIILRSLGLGGYS